MSHILSINIITLIIQVPCSLYCNKQVVEYLSKQSYANSSAPSQPLTAKDQKEITFNRELVDNVAVIEYEEFIIDGNLESIKKKLTPKQKLSPEISFPPHQEQLVNIKLVQQVSRVRVFNE